MTDVVTGGGAELEPYRHTGYLLRRAQQLHVAPPTCAAAPRSSSTRGAAGRALGADLGRLERALDGSASGAQDAAPVLSGLREDQAAAALTVLSDGRRVSVINAPAGSGKTQVLAEAAKAWAAAGLGPVIGITAAQSARNTLAPGVPTSYNSAQFLGHLPGQRGARGHVPIGVSDVTNVRRPALDQRFPLLGALLGFLFPPRTSRGRHASHAKNLS